MGHKPHIKYLIARYNFYANVNNYETISMRHSVLKNLDTKTDEKYLNNFLEYAHETISKYSDIIKNMYHLIGYRIEV